MKPAVRVLAMLALVSFVSAGGALAGLARGSGADLAVLNVEPRPYVAPGASFDAVDTTKNVGTAEARASVTAYYLSTRPERGPLAARLGLRPVDALPANAVSRGRVPLVLPEGTGGEYYLVACADDESAVADGNRGDNCRAAAAPLFASDVPRGRQRDATTPSGPTLTLAAAGAAAVSGDTVYFRPGAGGAATVTAVAQDAESGVNHVAFPDLGTGWTGGGEDPAPPYAARYSFDAAAKAAGVVAVRAVNGTGIASVAALSIVADETPPAIAFRCADAPCTDAPYQAAAVTVALELTDVGSGVFGARYTVDGSTPSITNGLVYAAPIELSETATVKVVAYDRVGNASSVATQRVEIAAPATATALTPTLEEAAAVTAFVTAQEGGSLSATGSDGTRYILSIPGSALFEDVEVTMTPIAAIGGLPLSGGLAAGVDLKPEGLRFAKPARLIMLPARPPSALGTAAFVYDGEGTGFRLHPYTRLISPGDGSTRIVLALNHFTGAGAGGASPDDLAALAASMPQAAEARLEHAAALLAKERECQLAGTTCVPEEQIAKAIEDGLRAWHADVKAKVEAAASGEMALLQEAFTAATAWMRAVQLLAASSAEFDAKYQELEAGIATALNAAKRAQANRCFAGDFSAIPKLYSLAGFEALTGIADDDLDVDSVVDRCLVFEVTIDSTLSRTSRPYGDHVLEETARVVATYSFRLRDGYDFGSIGRGVVRFEEWRSQVIEDGVKVDCALARGDAKLGLAVGFDESFLSGKPGGRMNRLVVSIPTTSGVHQWVEESSCGSASFNVWLDAWKRWHQDEAEPEPTFGVPHTFTITSLDEATATGARKSYSRTWSDSTVDAAEETTITAVHAPER